MTEQEILNIINKQDTSGMLSREKYLNKHYPEVLQYIKNFAKKYNFINMSISQLKWHIKNKIYEIPKCKTCGKELKFKNSTIGYPNFCSKSCTVKNKETQEKYKQTMLKKYGVEHNSQTDTYKKKFKNTMLKRYGVEHALQNENIKNKMKQTTFQRYGKTSIFKVKEYQEKIKQTMLQKYGSTCAISSDTIKNKIKQTVLKRYGVNSILQDKTTRQKISKTTKNNTILKYKKEFNNVKQIINIIDSNNILIKCEKCNENRSINNVNILRYRLKHNLPIYCTECLKQEYISNFQTELQLFLNKLNVNYTRNNRSIISPLELDIYIPEYDLAIETNGIYWHSELFKDKFYHQNKLNLSKNKNIRLIQIWEDDWYLKQNIIKHRLNIIFNKEKVLYARKCEIKELNSKEYRQFLNIYHLQGYVTTKIKLGLFYNNELVSAIGFGSLRKSMNQQSKENEYELYRFAEKHHVVGGLAKLFKYFIKQYNPTKITTYQDLDWGYSNLYEKLGFKLEKITDPSYFYVVNGIRENRYKYRKQQLIKEGFDENKTEHEIMLERGYYKIYNSGNIKWIWTNK